MRLTVYSGQGKTCLVFGDLYAGRAAKAEIYNSSGVKVAEWNLYPIAGVDTVCTDVLQPGYYRVVVSQGAEPIALPESVPILYLRFKPQIFAEKALNVYVCINRTFGQNCTKDDADIRTQVPPGVDVPLGKEESIYRVSVHISSLSPPLFQIVRKRAGVEEVVYESAYAYYPATVDIRQALVPLPPPISAPATETLLDSVIVGARIIVYALTLGISVQMMSVSPVAALIPLVMLPVVDMFFQAWASVPKTPTGPLGVL